jgi:hypothetical protein
MYVPLDQEWDFVTPSGKDIKGGNYYFVLWREGSQDYSQAMVSTLAAKSTPANPIQHESISVFMELSFKDG